MRIAMVSCYMKTTYGAYTDGLCRALEPLLGDKVDLISSNCGCGDPHATSRIKFAPGARYVELPNVNFYPWEDGRSKTYKYDGRLVLGKATYWGRAKVYSALARKADLVHFQQVLGAFGSRPVFEWLRTDPNVRKVVTVHELDDYQREFPRKNLTYNLADRLIVMFDEMRERLVSLGVSRDKIDVVHCGTQLVAPNGSERRDIVYYGGHHFSLDKGIDTLLKAFKRIVAGGEWADLRLNIHGHYGTEPPADMVDLVAKYDLNDHVTWLNTIYEDEVTRRYSSSLFLVVPFKGSSAGMVASRAMACGLPVIATRDAGLPDHLGDLGIYIDFGDDAAMEKEMRRLLDDREAREGMAAPLRQRAEELYSWDRIARDTLAIYQDVVSG